jgi:hypothetical protein
MEVGKTAKIVIKAIAGISLYFYSYRVFININIPG